MNKAHVPINWENYPSDETPLNERNLNKMDSAIGIIDDNVVTLDATKATKTEVATLVADVTFEESTGIITITKKNGSKITIDTQMEKIAINFDYNPTTQQIILTLIDGTKQYIDLSALITQYEFLDSDTVAFYIDKDGKVSAIVKEGSIEEKHLEPNYLAKIKVEVAKAESSQQAAAKSEANAKASENAAKASETAAKTSETNAKASETAAAKSATAAEASESNAKVSETSASESSATATEKASSASQSADTAAEKADIATQKAAEIIGKAESAEESATKAQSYAVGGTGSREGEDSDNAKYYYQQAKDVSEGLKGGLQPHGTVAFADLPALADVSTGWMFNISDEFTTTDDFKEGVGNVIPAGANIYKTSDGKWDVLAGTPVTGIKGAKEKSYRRGNVDLTAANIGAVAIDGDTAENTTAFSMASARENLESGEKHNILFGKIAKWFADLKTVAFSGSYNDLSNKPTIPTVGNGKVTITQNGATKGSFTMNQSGNTTVTLTDNNTTYDLSKYLALTGGTVTGTLVLSKTTDLSGTSDNRPALIVGGAATGVHIEIDNNEIQGKKNEKTPNQIVINADGGDVTIGDTANEYSTTIRNDLIVNKNFYPENSIKMNQSEWLDCIVNYVDSNGAGRADALRLIGCNSSGNVHMGGYSDITIAPVYLHASGKQYNFTDAAFCPNVTNNVHLGLASKLWKTVYAKTGTINTSDRNKKHDIKDLTEVYEQLFLKLQPKSFIFNDGDRVHIGAISQDVETAMQELGIEAKQFAGFCKDIRYEYTEFSEEDGMPIESSKVPCKDEDGNIIYDYALRYQEFIFLTVHMVQRLWSRLDAIEKENAEIKEQIKSMQQDIEELKKVRA